MLDGEEYLDKEITDNLLEDSFNKPYSSAVVDSTMKEIEDTFNSKNIPEYFTVNRFALHSSFLAYTEALKNMNESGQNKVAVVNFKILKELFDKDLVELKKSQEIEKKMYLKIKEDIQNYLEETAKKVYEDILKKCKLDTLDIQRYEELFNSLNTKILNCLNSNILNTKNYFS